ncbi:unnamed protein product [Parascedosporium putredinis]|uniref:Major facilitator superfamily (MFS) profile domain-containing protein n=1 Tax=Parascedosporium putredinis TaxID=1442378 RepID=A0A9P1H407_9PEZI|nr:unnamed protein product [Parascedosporium putredinis]CAI7996175.1 unnamed protein product [Parascedosporium putredinis]
MGPFKLTKFFTPKSRVVHKENDMGDSSSSIKDFSSQENVQEKEGLVAETPFRTVLLVVAAILPTMIVVSLDRIIMATATPKITDELNSIRDIGWYGSAYQLASCSTQLFFSRLYQYFDNKILFLISVLLFEAGSILCATASVSAAVIAGRVVSGLGSAGVMAGAIAIMIPLVPLHKRVFYQGIFASIFAISPLVGPLIGAPLPATSGSPGVGVSGSTCPWAVSASSSSSSSASRPPGAPRAPFTFRCLDPVGTALFVPSIVCLLLALEWGGTTHPWSSPRIVALLVLFGILLIAWYLSQHFGKEHATAPPRILLQRSVAAGVLFTICFGGIMLSFHYYIAIWLQAVRGLSPVESGIRTLPFVVAFVCVSILTGATVKFVGHYAQFPIACACCMAVAMGLVTTLRVDTEEAPLTGFLIFLGAGMGLGAQIPSIAAQTVLTSPDDSMGSSLMIFGQNLGSAIFLSVSQNVFLRSLISNMSGVVPGAGAQILAGIGSTSLRETVPARLLPAALEAYSASIVATMRVPLGIACVSIIPALAFEWRSVKRREKKKEEEEADEKVVSSEEGPGAEKGLWAVERKRDVGV